MGVAKTIELTSTSSEGFESAIREAIVKASETVRNIEGAWVRPAGIDPPAGRWRWMPLREAGRTGSQASGWAGEPQKPPAQPALRRRRPSWLAGQGSPRRKP